jgi:hypothetical protein
MTARLTSLITACAVIAIGLAETSAASAATGPQHGCGGITVGSRPWKSHVTDAPLQTGDHWIVWWEGKHGSCSFAKQRAATLIKTITSKEADQVVFQWQGGRCVPQRSRGHQTIDPFWKTGCNLPMYAQHRTYHPVVYVMVDPDPRYIH